MNSERTIIANGNKIEEYYWGGKYVVYKNDKLVYNSFEEEVKSEQDKAEKLVKSIHIPDIITGFCYKCGKYSKEYGKLCSEIKVYHT